MIVDLGAVDAVLSLLRRMMYGTEPAPGEVRVARGIEHIGGNAVETHLRTDPAAGSGSEGLYDLIERGFRHRDSEPADAAFADLALEDQRRCRKIDRGL